MFPKSGPHLPRRAVLVVGCHLDNYTRASGAVALVDDLFINDAGDFAGSLFDGASNVVGGHIGSLGFFDKGPQANIKIGIPTPGARGNSNLLR